MVLYHLRLTPTSVGTPFVVPFYVEAGSTMTLVHYSTHYTSGAGHDETIDSVRIRLGKTSVFSGNYYNGHGGEEIVLPWVYPHSQAPHTLIASPMLKFTLARELPKSLEVAVFDQDGATATNYAINLYFDIQHAHRR